MITRKLVFFVFTLLVSLIAVGCAGNNAANSSAATPAPAKAANPAAARAAATPPAPAPKSTFTIDGASRDPFNPQAKRAVTANSSGQAVAPVENGTDVAKQLKEGLQGIGGTSDQRVAMINNVILEAGRSAEISLSKNRTIKVRCREITRDSVMLDVEGHGPITVSRNQML